MLKVLHVIDSFNIGGAEKLVSSYILETKNNQINDAAILFESNTFIREELVDNGVKIADFSSVVLYKKLIRLIKLIKSEKYDIVHAHLFPANYLCSLASLFVKNTKFIATEHSVDNKRRKKKVFKYIEKIIYSRFDCIIACSEQTKVSLKEWIGDRFEIITVANGIKRSEIINLEQLYDIILVGSLRSNVKGVDILLESLSKIKSNFNKAVIVGDGIEKEKLIKLRDSLGLETKVEFLGIRQDINALLDKSKVYVMPSRYEGLPLALLEAMSKRKAIIASNILSISKIIEDNKDGLLFELCNSEELASKLVLILKDDNMRENLGSNALKKFYKQYDISIYCENINKIYMKVLLYQSI